MTSTDKYLYDASRGDWFKIALESDINETLGKLDNHELKLINSEQGLHGIRVWQGKIQETNDKGTTWIDIVTSGNPNEHSHEIADIDGLQSILDSKIDANALNLLQEDITDIQSELVNKGEVKSVNGNLPDGNGNVTITVDGGQALVDLQEHLDNENNPHNVTASQIGLGNVDNTSDLDKPISSATQIALDSKLDSSAISPIEQSISDLEVNVALKGNVKTVNGINPDANGNIEIPSSGGVSITVEDVLTSNSSNNALSAYQGNLLDNKITTHDVKIATTSRLGHVKVDGTTITIDTEGVISSVAGESGLVVPNITDLIATSSDDGKSINVTWVNPKNNEFIRTEVYTSRIDISNYDISTISTVATKVVSDKTTTIYSQETIVGETWYFKVFAVHGLFGERYSTGLSTEVTAVDTEPPSTISYFTANFGDSKVNLSWVNPTVLDFQKVVIRHKTDDYPTSITDGQLAYEGSANSIELSSLTNGTEYYFRAFTLDKSGNMNDDTINQTVSATPSASVIYGVKIDYNNSNPETSVTYTDAAINMTSGSSWDNMYPFRDIKPVLLDTNGVEIAELDKNNFKLDINGNSVNITSEHNVMIKIPKIWYKIETIGSSVYVKISNVKYDATYQCYGHTDGTTERDAFYVGAYLSFNQSSVLKSWSGKAPSSGITLSDGRVYARANGNRYNLLGFYQLTVLQILQLIRAKNLDSQSVYGKGRTDATSLRVTGNTNTKGLFTEYDADGTNQVKIVGVEDFYGNLSYFVDGIKADANRKISTTKNPSNFNNNATGYDTYETGVTADINGFVSKIQGTTELGFTVKQAFGSETTYFTDNAKLATNSFMEIGGKAPQGTSAGVYCLQINAGNSLSSTVGFRLMYL